MTTATLTQKTARGHRTPDAVVEENGMAILEKRYLDGETVDQMWDRVSGGNVVYRKLMSTLRFLPNSPTLFNAGRNNGCTLSACFVFDVQDNFLEKDGICESRAKAAAVAKAGGGVGYYLGLLRPKGAEIRTTKRGACGPVTVLRDFHGLSKLIFQGGKRFLAQMGVLPVWHADVREFIHCKDEDPQGLGSFNISVGWTDQWAHRALAHREGDTLTPEWELWQEQCQSAWSHGCPGMFFPDIVNRGNPNLHLGTINAPNPCGETPNRNNEPCNLGSLVASRYFDASNRVIDWNLLEEDVWNATLFLDDILDRNEFPHPDIAAAALLTRKLGLGVMGWADLLAMLHIDYASQDALVLADKFMRFISEVSHAASVRLAAVKGPYGGYDPDKTTAPLRRNETTTSIAPTGTIGIIAGVKGFSIEPWYAEQNSRTTGEGLVLTEKLPTWMREKLDGFIPKCTHEIAPEWHVRMQAAFQKHTDLGVSKTVNLPKSATVQDVSDAYKLMFELNCKGGTIYRDGCRDEQVLVATKTKSVFMVEGMPPSPTPAVNQSAPVIVKGPYNTNRRAPTQERTGATTKLKIGGQSIFLTHNVYLDGSLCEIFVNGDFGNTIGGLLDSFCITFSTALQHGVPLAALVENHQGKRFDPAGLVDHPDVRVCTSVVDAITRFLQVKYGDGKESSPRRVGTLCPDCGAITTYQAGCLTCSADGCGWTRCG